MISFLKMLSLTFAVMISAAMLINYAKKRQRNSKHQLTGMCHKTGGTVCSSCTPAKSNGVADKNKTV